MSTKLLSSAVALVLAGALFMAVSARRAQEVLPSWQAPAPPAVPSLPAAPTGPGAPATGAEPEVPPATPAPADEGPPPAAPPEAPSSATPPAPSAPARPAAPAPPSGDPAREPSAPAQQVPEPFSVLEDAAARYRAAATVCADFDQELSIPLLGETRRGHGRICQRQPNLFMMRFEEPAGDRVVADGEYLWVYTPSNDPGQVIRTLLGSAAGPMDFHREFLEDPASKYTARLTGQETVDGSQTHRVVLEPRRPAAYREAVLWIDVRQGLVRRLRIQEENGSVRTLSLSNIQLNGTPPADAFRFTPPAGTQVLTP